MNQNLCVNKTKFHMKGFALGLALRQRWSATWKLPIISTLEMEQYASAMQANISVTFLLTSNTHFQDCHTHFCGIFAFSDILLRNQARRLIYILSIFSFLRPSQLQFVILLFCSQDDPRTLFNKLLCEVGSLLHVHVASHVSLSAGTI